MPELPEVEVIRRSLAPLEDMRLAGVAGHAVRLRRPLAPRRWRECLVGNRLERVERRGKYLLLHFGEYAAVVHLGMSGRLLLGDAQCRNLPHTHLRLLFDDGRVLLLVDPRRFGMAEVVAARELTHLPCLAVLGEDAMLGDVHGALARALPRSRSAVWSVLLDQRVLAGVGNIYANEALARAGIAPLRTASSLCSASRQRLAAAIPEVLAEAVEQGGTTLADGGFVDGGSRSGYFAVRLRVYGREGQECRECHTPILRLRRSGRSVFFCPCCQR